LTALVNSGFCSHSIATGSGFQALDKGYEDSLSLVRLAAFPYIATQNVKLTPVFRQTFVPP